MTDTLSPAHSPSSAALEARSVGDIAATLPGATAVFRRHKLAFCCGGEASLADAAAQKGIALDTLLAELSVLAAQGAAPGAEDKGALAGHIVERYHETHRRELPELLRLARKVERVHGDHPAAPHGLADRLEDLVVTLDEQMAREEAVLFPALVSGKAVPASEITSEHAALEAAVHDLEHLTGGFEPPAGACRSWQALYAGGAKLADDLRGHIALERTLAS